MKTLEIIEELLGHASDVLLPKDIGGIETDIALGNVILESISALLRHHKKSLEPMKSVK